MGIVDEESNGRGIIVEIHHVGVLIRESRKRHERCGNIQTFQRFFPGVAPPGCAGKKRSETA